MSFAGAERPLRRLVARLPFAQDMKALLKRVAARDASRRFARRAAPHPAEHEKGLNIVGFARAPSGLGQSLRAFAHACKSARVPFVVREVGPTAGCDDATVLPWLAPRTRYCANLLCFNPEAAYRVPWWLRAEEWQGRYNIGVWYWELARFPEAWRYALDLVDEVWVTSPFIAQAVAAVTRKPVHVMPLAVECAVPTPFARSRWGLDDARCLFLFSYDGDSFVMRKNPAAVVKAFRRAFPRGTEAAELLVKSINGAGARRELEDLAGGDPRIRLIDASLGRDEMLALIAAADCYVSLHRAEGFGLGLAEAMYLGKPVIATGYSGNLAFMDRDNACLIDYRLVPVGQGEYLHAAGQVWAEPDIEQAAAAMVRVAGDAAYRARIGGEAARTMRARHSHAALGDAVAARLRALDLL